MQAKIYGFKIAAPASVPISKFCEHLSRHHGKRFKHSGKYRRAFIRKRGSDWLVTLITEATPRDQVIEEEPADEENDKLTFRRESSENLPKTREIACLRFSERRMTGAVATYRGAFSISAICIWIATEYRELIRMVRDQELAASPKRNHPEIKKKYPLIKSVDCGPITRATQLDDELSRIREFGSIDVFVPEQPNDPGDVLRPLSSSVQVRVSFSKIDQDPVNTKRRVMRFIRRKHVSKGTVHGIDTDGKEQHIPIDEEKAYALDNISYDKLLEEDHLDADKLKNAAIFTELRVFMEKHPELFG